MRHAIVVIAWLAGAGPLAAQTTSADSAAIITLELEMSRLLAAGRIDDYATHLTADYARTTRQGKLETRDEALASCERARWVASSSRASFGSVCTGMRRC